MPRARLLDNFHIRMLGGLCYYPRAGSQTTCTDRGICTSLENTVDKIFHTCSLPGGQQSRLPLSQTSLMLEQGLSWSTSHLDVPERSTSPLVAYLVLIFLSGPGKTIHATLQSPWLSVRPSASTSRSCACPARPIAAIPTYRSETAATVQHLCWLDCAAILCLTQFTQVATS